MLSILVLAVLQEVVDIPGADDVRPFSIGVKEVTWAEFDRYRKEAVDGIVQPAQPDFLPVDLGLLPAEVDAPAAPATYLRWHAAVEYAAWLSAKSGAYWRLPTELEWRHAAKVSKDLVALDGGVWEYVLESEAPETYDPVVVNGKDRQRVPKAWSEVDPHRPRSLWYLFGGPASAAGLRLLRVEGPEGRGARDAAAAKVEVRVLKAGAPRERGQWIPLDVEARNGGDRTIDELEVILFALTPEGKPHVRDLGDGTYPGHPTFTRAWPVLPTSRLEGRRPPLKPGETRRFVAEVPVSYDDDAQVNPKAWAGRGVNARLSP